MVDWHSHASAAFSATWDRADAETVIAATRNRVDRTSAQRLCTGILGCSRHFVQCSCPVGSVAHRSSAVVLRLKISQLKRYARRKI
jgi:hypothetical protein